MAQLNCWNLFDPVDDPDVDDTDPLPSEREYGIRLEKLARTIVDDLGSPDVVSLQEFENQRVLDDLVALPMLRQLGYRTAVQANNNYDRGVRVGLLYKDAVLEQVGTESPNPVERIEDGADGQIDPGVLYSRPPLLVDFRMRGAAQGAEGARELTVVVNHFKSKRGGDERRERQGEYLGGFLDARRATHPNASVIVVGDLNADYHEPAYEKLATRPDGSARFFDAPMQVPDADRYTYRYRGQPNMLDHLLVSDDLRAAITKVAIPHINTADSARGRRLDPSVGAGLSDHDPMVATFDLNRLSG